MPPQSRGESSSSRSFSGTLEVPPTLGSFLNDVPSPSSTISDQRTPTGPLPNGIGTVHRSPPSSPTRKTSSGLSEGQLSTHGQDGDDEVTLDDTDFQSHYSRQSSPASSSSGDLSDTEDGIPHPSSPFTSPASHLHHSASSQSLPPPPPLPLYPPFYNRPPTPLPPSPSLTSLLRPPSLLNRSTTSTRPTTPDSSDAETPNDTEAAVAQSARRATVVERVAPKVPTYEYYGFVLYLASSLAFRTASLLSQFPHHRLTPVNLVLYILWSYLPSPFLDAIGLHYYPNRWWSLAIPAFLVMLLVYIYVALLSYNVEFLTLPLESVECIVDDAANIAVLDSKGKIRKGGSKRTYGRANGHNVVAGSMSRNRAEKMVWRQMWNEGTDAVMDVPIGGVCEILYGEGRTQI